VAGEMQYVDSRENLVAVLDEAMNRTVIREELIDKWEIFAMHHDPWRTDRPSGSYVIEVSVRQNDDVDGSIID
jgi:hypothetical protein